MSHHTPRVVLLVLVIMLMQLFAACLGRQGIDAPIEAPTATVPPTISPTERPPTASTPAATVEIRLDVGAETPEEATRVFFYLLQNTQTIDVNSQFMNTYFTDYFSSTEFDPAMVGAFATASLDFHEPIGIDNDNAIVKVDVAEAENRLSIVVFLQKTPSWKIDALRALALPGFVFELRALLRAKATLTPDEQWQLRDVKTLLGILMVSQPGDGSGRQCDKTG